MFLTGMGNPNIIWDEKYSHFRSRKQHRRRATILNTPVFLRGFCHFRVGFIPGFCSLFSFPGVIFLSRTVSTLGIYPGWEEVSDILDFLLVSQLSACFTPFCTVWTSP